MQNRVRKDRILWRGGESFPQNVKKLDLLNQFRKAGRFGLTGRRLVGWSWPPGRLEVRSFWYVVLRISVRPAAAITWMVKPNFEKHDWRHKVIYNDVLYQTTLKNRRRVLRTPPQPLTGWVLQSKTRTSSNQVQDMKKCHRRKWAVNGRSRSILKYLIFRLRDTRDSGKANRPKIDTPYSTPPHGS